MLQKKYLYYGLGFFVLMFLLTLLTNVLPDILWFQNLGYVSIFFTRIKLQVVVWLCAFLCSFGFIFFNFNLARKFFEKTRVNAGRNKFTAFLNNFLGVDFFSHEKIINLTPSYLKSLAWIVAALAFFMALSVAGFFSGWWLKVAVFFKQTLFNTADPLFNKDIGFYVFTLPFLKLFFSQTGVLLFFSAFGSLFFYLLSGEMDFWSGLKGTPKKHLSFLGFLFSLWLLLGVRIAAFDLLFSHQGIVFGAGFTDIYGHLISLKILMFLLALLAILFLVNMRYRGLRLPIIGAAVVLLVAVLLGGLYPALLQKLFVSPNELDKERPFIEHSIKYTRAAYQLEKIKTTELDYVAQPDKATLRENSAVINNVRVWDPAPLRDTYKQIQEIRLYYDFNDIDIDRYMIDGRPQQLMLAARELDSEQIPVRAKNWINERLMYTHGYGVVANKVNEVTPEGLPRLIIKDIPPVSSVLKLSRPEIYYGEKTNGYVIVNTTTDEFDYPSGEENKYNRYEGDGGIVLSNFFRKFIYALKFSDLKLLISGYIKKDSKILYERNIMARVNKIMPFISYDADPYIVIDDETGRLYWLVDGYTTTGMYPYSQPYSRNINYIRNAVKVVIDAYNGSVSFYLADSTDPIINTYAAVFPGVFKPLQELPAGLKGHLRYPEDLFSVQAAMYRTYHMTDVGVFYNLEDLWEFARQKYEQNTVVMNPYYFYGKLPGKDNIEYLLAMPFTPAKKNNLIALLAVNCDPQKYGEFSLIKMPKKELVYGPLQVDARIDQDADISKELTLWSQDGSSVIRGNMLIIPLAQSLLFVEPIYLQAASSKIPELKRVVVAQGDKLAMQVSFAEAFSAVLQMNSGNLVVDQMRLTLKELADQAAAVYQRLETALKNGQWQESGKKMAELKEVILKMGQEH